jgi:hypothetical protein
MSLPITLVLVSMGSSLTVTPLVAVVGRIETVQSSRTSTSA